MVEFYDPVEKEQASYHIDKKLLTKWDKLKGGLLKKKDEDRVYIVDGRERTGKSVFTFQQAKYLDPSFSIERICFTPDEFLKQIRNSPQGSVIVFDEAFRGLSSKSTQSKVNKAIVQAMMEIGQRNLVIFIVLPTFFLLELYAAVLRSNALFHIYKDKRGMRAFKIYNYHKKIQLYQVGRKKGYSYAFPRVRAIGRFYGKYAINEESYRKKKADSLRHIEITKKEEDHYSVEQKNILMVETFKYMKEANPKWSYQKHSDWLKEKGITISKQCIWEILKKSEKEIIA